MSPSELALSLPWSGLAVSVWGGHLAFLCAGGRKGALGLGGNGLMSAHYCVSTSALWFCVLLYEQHGNRKIGN